MHDNRQDVQASESLKGLKCKIGKIRNDEDRRISECMVVVLSALDVGADVDRLVERTGYSREFIESISVRMREAGIWIGELVDDREWRNKDEELMSDIFRHALVAQGTLVREPNEDGGCTYFDTQTREWSAEWHPGG